MKTEVKIKSHKDLKAQIKEWQSQGNKVVFTNGCFDILHLGHIDYLEKAAAMGDKLVVGLNSDDSVRELKGPERPVNKEYARSRMLAALSFVDGLTVFSEKTPRELITYLLPDILVKGSDYSVETIVGADVVLGNGGEVKTIDLVEGYSTSNIIEKIKDK
ncbi:D-glycero-beta-D-manno-heptose 1-phosphate adenylyltransferase [Roseivirga sp.]|uniref:D-glycero-beta-D-manno-heptose 1-phosphate adenylyltransferase n=1 Tax=Roseivirga sp. TaxID=1964215 RepID=UPI003B519B1A